MESGGVLANKECAFQNFILNVIVVLPISRQLDLKLALHSFALTFALAFALAFTTATTTTACWSGWSRCLWRGLRRLAATTAHASQIEPTLITQNVVV